MSKDLKFKELLRILERVLEQIPDGRRGPNRRYSLKEAGVAAFAVFFMQSPSFLAYQRHMQQQQGRNNARSLFGLERIPSDGQIRNLLDEVDVAWLREPFWEVFKRLAAQGQLERYRGIGGTYLLSLDGAQYFSSQRIHCPHCRVRERDGHRYYSHEVLMAVLCGPKEETVLCLEPEFIRSQDGEEKQDCEQQAIKRWIERNSHRFAPWSVTVLTDDLHCHHPLCVLLLWHQMHFILTCKPSSHPALYEELALLEKVEGAIGTLTIHRWNGRHHERWVYRWAERLPLRQMPDTLWVNWCELTIIHDKTGKTLYHNSWATDHPVNAQTVVEIARDGRCRWKVENEGLNVLTMRGYHFDHNYGHGQHYLAAVLLTLLLLAFVFHTVFALTCPVYQAVRRALGARRTFFDDLRALTRYLYFEDWQHLLSFMAQQLEVAPG